MKGFGLVIIIIIAVFILFLGASVQRIADCSLTAESLGVEYRVTLDRCELSKDGISWTYYTDYLTAIEGN